MVYLEIAEAIFAWILKFTLNSTEICGFDVTYSRKFWPSSTGQGIAMDIPVQTLTTNHSNDSAPQDHSINANFVSVAPPIKTLYPLKWD